MVDQTNADWPDHEPIPFDDPRVPEAIRAATTQYVGVENGAMFYRQTRDGAEWWLISEKGELLDIFML